MQLTLTSILGKQQKQTHTQNVHTKLIWLEARTTCIFKNH